MLFFRSMKVTVAALSALGFVSGAETGLRSESELTHNCFNFPSDNFNRNNAVKAMYGSSPHTAGGLEVGDKAFDFTLSDLDGTTHTLGQDLREACAIALGNVDLTLPGAGTEHLTSALTKTMGLNRDLQRFCYSNPPRRARTSQLLQIRTLTQEAIDELLEHCSATKNHGRS